MEEFEAMPLKQIYREENRYVDALANTHLFHFVLLIYFMRIW